MKFNPNRNRVYTKKTHCKDCKKSFEEVTKYFNHALCEACYKRMMRIRNQKQPMKMIEDFKIEQRKDIYKERREELKAIKVREEWLKVIERNLFIAMEEIKDKQLELLYDNN